MKNFTFLLTCCLISLQTFAQFPESFSSGTTTMPTGWVSFIGDNGYGTTKNWKISDTGGYAFIEPEDVSPNTSEDWLVTPQFTVNGSQHILSFLQSDFYAQNNGSVYTIRVSTGTQLDQSAYTTVATYFETDMAATILSPEYIDLSAYAGQQIYVAFVMEQQNGDFWYLDDINVTGDMNLPDPAINPTPGDTSIDVAIDDSQNTQSVTMSWQPATTGSPAAYYRVYYGDNVNNMSYLGSVSETSVTVDYCLYNQTYYWKVIPTNVAGDAIGVVDWTYTTQNNALSLDNTLASENFTLYPNPFTANITIKTNTPISSIKLVNQLGQQVKVINEQFTQEKTINLEDLNTGIYFLIVDTAKNSTSVKVIKS